MTGIARTLVAVVLAATFPLACASASAPARDVRLTPTKAGAPVNQFELQEDVQRFTGDLLTRMSNAMEPLADAEPSPAVREQLLRFSLATASAALDIASGPLPELNVLDMVVFVSLTRITLERHWVPVVFGERARPLLAAFELSEAEAWKLAEKVLSADQKRYVASLIQAWSASNPDVTRVQLLRFKQFAELAGQVREEDREKTRGLLGSVRGATKTADQALLMSERAIFLAQRMPFLLRLQARLGAQEVIGDSLLRFTSHDLAAVASRSGPLLGDLRALSSDSRETVRELKLLLGEVEPLVTSGELKLTLDAANDLTGEGLALVRELNTLEPGQAAEAATALENRAARFSDRVLLLVFMVGVGWIVLFWAGYYLAKRLTRKPADSESSDRVKPGAPRLGHA